MWLKKNDGDAEKNLDDLIAAIVMPLAGHSDEDVKEFLTNLHAEVRPLANGFMSVNATRQTLKAVSAIARVDLKTRKQMH